MVEYKKFDGSEQEFKQSTQKGFKKKLKSEGYDNILILRGALDLPEFRSALRQRFTSNFGIKAPLKALKLDQAYLGGSTVDLNSFLVKILGQQKASLETLEFKDSKNLTLQTCKKINKWMKHKQVIGFTLQESRTKPEIIQEIFKVQNLGKPIQLQQLKLVDVKLAGGCFLSLTHLTSLTLKNMLLSKVVWRELCSLVQNTHTLKALITSECIGTPDKARSLGKAVGHNKTIERLDLMKEDEHVSVSMIQLIFHNKSLTEFNFRPHHYPCNVTPLLSALKESLQNAKTNLTSIDLGRIQVSQDILDILDTNVAFSKRGNKLVKGVADKITQGTLVETNAYKAVLTGTGSNLLFTAIFDQVETECASRGIRNNPVIVVKSDPQADGGKEVMASASGDDAHAESMLGLLEEVVKAELSAITSPEVNKTQNDVADKPFSAAALVAYCTKTACTMPSEQPRKSVTVSNVWPGFKVGDTEIALVQRVQEDTGVYLVSFLLSKMLSSNFGEEVKKLVWLLHQVPDTAHVVLVGLVDEDLSEENLESFNFGTESFKYFLSNKVWEMLPQTFRERLTSNNHVEQDARNPQEDLIVFLSYNAYNKESIMDLNYLWESIEIRLPTALNDVDARWFIILNTLKTPETAPPGYTSFRTVSNEATELGVNEVSAMIKYFEQTGDLLVLPAGQNEINENSLIVLSKFWLQSTLEQISSEGMLPKNFPQSGIWADTYVKELWENEEKWVSDILTTHAENLGILIKLNDSGDWLLPNATGNCTHTERNKARYKDSKPLLWIQIPRHYSQLEIFKLFSVRLLKNVVAKYRVKSPQQMIWRDSTSLGYAPRDSDDYAWARCDTSSNRILLGMPEQLFDIFSTFLELVRQALKETIELVASFNHDLLDFGEETVLQKAKRYPHLVFRSVTKDNEVMEQLYDEAEDALKPEDLLNVPERVDVCLISFSRSPYANFIASVLQLEGVSVDCKRKITKEEQETYRVILVLLGDDEEYEVVLALQDRTEKVLWRSMEQKNLNSYQKAFEGINIKSLEDIDRPDAVLNELIVDVLRELGE